MSSPASSHVSRRRFLATGAAAAISFPFVSRLGAASANGMLNHASFGSSGMAGSDIGSLTATKLVNLVAVADVDEAATATVRKNHPNARIYKDWRELLDKEEKNIESVNVSTPDHMHAPIGLAAIALKKHVYGQKPLAQNVWETRQLTLAARKAGVVTQMGIQIHSHVAYRTAARLIQDQAIGKVKEVHTWSSKKWGDPAPLPTTSDPVPAGLDWNLWLGVAADRPFIKGYYHPGNWRKRLDLGTGTFGDMGCHIYDPVFKALNLTSPISLRSEGDEPTATNWGINAVIHYVFPGNPLTADKTVNVTWYDGDKRPPGSVLEGLGPDIKLPDQGSIFLGTKGAMLLPHIGMPVLLPKATFADFAIPKLDPVDHYRQFVEACRGNGKTSAHFDYAGALTETILLGGVATRFPKATLQWDVARMAFHNLAEANPFLRRKEYRKGWEPKWV